MSNLQVNKSNLLEATTDGKDNTGIATILISTSNKDEPCTEAIDTKMTKNIFDSF